ncbi:MAG: acyl carrier protein [Hyphomicrobiales bacterium]|nr:acyl carrier protein [Hyphomicrobiales bacterium]
MALLGEARDLIAAALGRSPHTVADNAAVGRQQGWDSLGHLSIVLMLEGKIGRMLRPDEIGTLRSVADVAALLHKEHAS